MNQPQLTERRASDSFLHGRDCRVAQQRQARQHRHQRGVRPHGEGWRSDCRSRGRPSVRSEWTCVFDCLSNTGSKLGEYIKPRITEQASRVKGSSRSGSLAEHRGRPRSAGADSGQGERRALAAEGERRHEEPSSRRCAPASTSTAQSRTQPGVVSHSYLRRHRSLRLMPSEARCRGAAQAHGPPRRRTAVRLHEGAPDHQQEGGSGGH